MLILKCLCPFREPYVLMENTCSVKQRYIGLVKMAEALARQWFGYVVYPENWQHEWVVSGLGSYAAWDILREVTIPQIFPIIFNSLGVNFLASVCVTLEPNYLLCMTEMCLMMNARTLLRRAWFLWDWRMKEQVGIFCNFIFRIRICNFSLFFKHNYNITLYSLCVQVYWIHIMVFYFNILIVRM